MKIASISVYQHELEVVNGPYVYAGGSMKALTTSLVKITGDNGNVGWGETCPLGPTYQPAHALGALAGLRELAPSLIGLEALPRVAGQKMHSALDGHLYAKAAIDIALYDLMGRTLGQPVHVLLGGALRSKIPSYYAISIMSPDKTARAVQDKQREGYRALQIKIGCGDVRQDAEVLRAAFGVLAPGVTLAADANRSMTTSEIVHLSALIPEIPVAFEQPCRTIQETDSLHGRLHHPIYLDEATENVATVLSVLGQGNCDGFGMKVTRVGGLSPMIAVRDMAEARRVPMSVDDSWGGDIIAAACVHMGSTVSPELFRGTWLAAPYIEQHYDRENGIQIVDGHIDVPSGPGLGISPDESQFGAPAFQV
ncbi:MAG: mandelate racemase/muconate lactonizing enzyme family protein [Alphaproteobacteria bacterium]|nr:mandelate racemase/muconate lactonizing enzyme family protein [Alphaproteobacteria bacterium]